MATISNNEIKIKYSLDTTDLANATALFDKLSAEDRQLLNDLKRLQAQFQATGDEGEKAGNKIGGGSKSASGSINDLQKKVNDLTAVIKRINPEAAHYEAVVNRLKKAKDNLRVATDALNKGLGNTGQAVTKARQDLNGLSGSIKQVGLYIGTYFSVQALVGFGKQVIQTTIQFEALNKAIQFTSGSVSAGLANFKFLEETAKELGLPLVAAAEGFKSMSAAANRAGITFKEQQKMFLDLSKGMAALSLTSQDASLVFFGFGQLMSKNKVSAQELYHQIGERLPIAMQAAQMAAAKVTGQIKVTASELIKLVEDGKLMSSEFAPAFTDAIAKIAGDSAKIDTLGKNFTRLGTAWDEMLAAMGNSTEGFWYQTTKFFTKGLEILRNLIAGNAKEVSDAQAKAFTDTYNQYEKASIQAIDLAIKQKEAQVASTEAIKKTADAAKKSAEESIPTLMKVANYLPFINVVSGTIQEEILRSSKQASDQAAVSAGKAKGELDALIKLRTELSKKKDEDKAKDEEAEKAAEKLYKKLINQQEALMKAEEKYIHSRTKAGTNQDILLLQNRVHFNNEMLKIDQDARFKDLELAKNNAVVRQGEIQKDTEAEQELIRQARFKAFALESEYYNKTIELIQDNKRKRKQELQTDEQNELDKTKDFYDDKLIQLEASYKEARKIEGQSKDSLELLEINYQNLITKLTKDGEQAREDIRAKYRAKEKQERIQTESEVRSVMVEASMIRNKALAKSESERADIADEGAMTQIKIKKDENNAQRILNEENTTLSIEERKNLNSKLEAEDVLLDAKLTEIVKQGEQRRLQEKEEKAKMAMEIAQTVSDSLFSIYNEQLSNELTALNNRYNEEVRLADGNKQKLAQLEQDKREKEKEIKIKQFRADQMAATARVIFATATQLMSSALNPALIPYIVGLSVAQLAAIAAQPVPEFAEGTKGKKFKGGPAIVGEKGVEKVITESGKVYFTPPTATLIDLPKGSQVIPNHALSNREIFMANALNQSKTIGSDSGIVPKLDEIGGILKSLPVHQVNMNEKGFEKFIRTPRRTTKILNSQFPNKF